MIFGFYGKFLIDIGERLFLNFFQNEKLFFRKLIFQNFKKFENQNFQKKCSKNEDFPYENFSKKVDIFDDFRNFHFLDHFFKKYIFRQNFSTKK